MCNVRLVKPVCILIGWIHVRIHCCQDVLVKGGERGSIITTAQILPLFAARSPTLQIFTFVFVLSNIVIYCRDIHRVIIRVFDNNALYDEVRGHLFTSAKVLIFRYEIIGLFGSVWYPLWCQVL